MSFAFTYFQPTGNPEADAKAQQIQPTAHYTADTLEDLLEFVVEHAAVSHKGGAGYILAGHCEGTRSAANTGPASFALIDWDDSPPLWGLLETYEGFGWTTHNHMKDGKPHWRFVIPFEEPVKHGKLPDPWKGAHIRNRAQPAFLPTHSENDELIEVRRLGGSRRLKAEAEIVQTVSSRIESTLLYGMFKRAGWLRDEGPNDGMWVRCPWVHEHTDQDESGTGILPDDSGLGLFTCRHGHCAHRHSGDAYAVLEALPCNAEFSTTPKAQAETSLASSVSTSVTPQQPSILRGADLDGPIPPVQWLCEGLQLCPGRPPILAADSGAGKSWATQALALAVASGQDVFGAFPCRQGPVLHVAQDSGMNATRRRYQRLARGMGLKLGELPIAVWNKRLTLVDRWGKFDTAHFAELDAEVVRMGAVLVVLDSLATICAGLEENSTEIAQPLWATTDPSCVWLWTHHTTKAGDVMRGSSAIKAAAGAIWGLTKTTDTREWELIKACEETDGKQPVPFVTAWVQDGEAARIEVARSSVNGPGAETVEQRIRREVLEAVRSGRAHSKRGVIEVVRGKRDQILAVLKDMTVRGQLIVRDSGKLVLPVGERS